MSSIKLSVTDSEGGTTDEDQIHRLMRDRPGVYSVVVCSRTGTIAIDFEDDETTADLLIGIVEQSGLEVQVIG